MATTTYDGALQGSTLTSEGVWSFEGRTYDTPADEAAVMVAVGEALQQPSTEMVQAAAKLTFKPGNTYTAQVLLAMADAYQDEVADGEGADPVAAVLREAARRIAVIEALTM